MMVHPGRSSARAAPPTLLLILLPLLPPLLLLLSNNCRSSDAFAFKWSAGAATRHAAAAAASVATTKLDAKKGGGMDAYAAQMAAMAMGIGISPATTAHASAQAERIASEMLDATRQRAGAAAATVPVGSYDDIEASTSISKLEASQALVLAKIASSIPDLALKPGVGYDASSGFVVGAPGDRVKLGASDAPGPANVAWLSDLCVDSRLSSLTVYCGPLTTVPHLISRCAVSVVGEDGSGGKRLELFLDFRPRSYGAYEMRNPSTGGYPGPDVLGRKSFEYSGARKDYETKFGTEEVATFLAGVRSSLVGAVDNPGLGDAGLSELETLTRGPLALDVTMPLSAGNVDAILSAREKATDIWLGWALDPTHRHRPGAPVNSQYVYDSKYKINAYGALLDSYVRLFGRSDGERLAAADSGPIDEAYVGGGS